MSVQSEIDRIKKNVNDTLKTISDTGVTVGAVVIPSPLRPLPGE